MVYFIGAGTGAVDLITVRGKNLIEKADVIIYAGSLVNPELLQYAKKGCLIYNSAKMTLDEVLAVMKNAEEEGKNTVRLHTGDPSIYGAIREQMDQLDGLHISYESCPGVSACFGAAASLNLEYTLPGISQSLIITRMEGRTKVPEKESIESFAAHGASMAIYLSTGLLEELSKRLITGGYKRDTPAAIVYKATWPEEEKYICTVGTLEETADKHGITKTALILVGDAIKPEKYEYSKLYDPTFETEFRKKTIGQPSLSVISFTEKGRGLSSIIKEALQKETSCEVTLYSKSEKWKMEKDGIIPCEDTLHQWTKKQFNESNGIIFIGATGIAVRAISACVKDKLIDIPVVVLDEEGEYAIPILSGHYGGANQLARGVAKSIGATPVITTATDVNGLFAVDEFAKSNGLIIGERNGIKAVASSLLIGEKVTIQVDGEFRGKVPKELTLITDNSAPTILVSPYKTKGFSPVLQLYPQIYYIGIGCRKNKTLQELEQMVTKHLSKLGIPMEAVAGFCSVDVKKEEQGIVALAKKYNLPFITYTPQELKEVQGEFTPSAFVSQQIGVDNVCERSAMASCGKGGKICLSKQAENGITIAIGEKKWSVSFDEI